MRAFFIDEPTRTRFGTRVKPTLGSAEILLRVNRVGLCGTDLNTYRGLNPLVTFPRIPGHEIAATIADIGADVPAGFNIDQRVTLNPYRNCGDCPACRKGRINACRANQTMGVQQEGALTDFIAVPWQRVVVTTLTDLNRLALVEPLAIGFHAVHRGEVTNKDTVAVFGCGVIGLSAIAAANSRGATVIAVDLDDGKLATARAVGAAQVINAAHLDPVKEIHRLTHNDGADVTIEAVGLADTMLNCINAVAPTGRVVYIGYSSKPVTFDTKVFLTKELDIRGSRNALQQDFDAAVRCIESGAFPADKAITRVFDFEHTDRALAEWSANPNAVTKFIIDLDATRSA